MAKAVGSEVRPFLGTAGVGDLIATATSDKSRNYTFGNYLSQGLNVAQIKEKMSEVAEGYRSVRFANKIIEAAELEAPLTSMLYNIIYNETPVESAMRQLISNPLSVDVDFL